MSNNAIQVQSEINLTVPEVLKGISKLETSELEDFFQHVGMLVARRKSPSLPVRESVLLQIINRGYPLELQARYTTLSAKLLTEQITDVEHEELLTLVVQLEQKNAERLQALLELAQIRGLSLEALMEDLNLRLQVMAAKWSAGRLRTFVAERAGYNCEYCRSPLSFSLQPFVVEHIVPSSKGGTDDPDNLACDCGGCNSYKYNKTEALDPASGRSVSLYHPRRQKWTDHFAWHDNFFRNHRAFAEWPRNRRSLAAEPAGVN
jgi:HNH endonuclease